MIGRIVLVAAAAGALALTFSAPVSAATGSVVATPASGLTDGQSVTAAAAGFATGEGIQVTECAAVGTSVGCDEPDGASATADANGKAAVSLTVRKSFTAYTNGAAVGSVWTAPR
ncbi:neocarzinostatin apoprotein domain-containing protein [Fodinicola feengrottensis]|uniref:neocarzinostatin apoprotein domain-containing protein n=1 Tax=Fodinicola feengrottensis TaxID=435914 RepID=UPI0013D797EC|nr:neocarzinostatin apoprotein domain-containing protein [Fodinicola feengrottensis]